jgi:uncharacterized protein (TIGR04255 family)
MATTYPHPSLRFVAFEVRFPPVPEFEEESAVRVLRSEFRRDYPYSEPFRVLTSVEVGPTDGVRQEVSLRNRFLSRTRTSAITLAANLLIVETSKYGSFEVFTDTVRQGLEAVSRLAPIAGFERVGLRYVNEVRVATPPEQPREWKSYIDRRLVSPACLLSHPAPTGFEGAVIYPHGDGHEVMFRFGARQGRMVNPQGPVRVEDQGDDPFFLLDIDSNWTHPPEELPDFDVPQILDLCDRLHEAAQDVFETSITDQLRTEVFGGEGQITR